MHIMIPEVDFMSNQNCNGRYTCVDIAIFASVIIGIVAGVLRFTAVITATPAFLWVVFGVAIGFLALLVFIGNRLGTVLRCGFRALTALLVGILGTVLFSVTLLGITFAATSVIGAIITGLLLGFFTLLVTASVCLIKNIVVCNS